MAFLRLDERSEEPWNRKNDAVSDIFYYID